MSNSNVPSSQLQDAQLLEADAYTHLYRMDLYPTGTLFLCGERSITWQGNSYQMWGITISGIGQSSDDSTSRPTFSLSNFTYASDGTPIRGVFSALEAQDKVEGSTLTRYKILKTDADLNNNVATINKWKVAKITSMTLDVITLELRNTLDGPVFQMPARLYIPPDFPQVSLS